MQSQRLHELAGNRHQNANYYRKYQDQARNPAAGFRRSLEDCSDPVEAFLKTGPTIATHAAPPGQRFYDALGAFNSDGKARIDG